MTASPPLRFADCVGALSGWGDESRSLAELLWAAATERSRLDVYRQADAALSGEIADRVRAWLDALRAGAPLQYTVGWTDFRGRRFACDRRALIPRPETEEWLDRLLDDPMWRRDAPSIADIGTGSGCLAVTLALERPAARVTAIDISEPALDLARENAGLHGVRDQIAWMAGDLLSPLADRSVDVIVANLPYVDADEWTRLPAVVRDHEPRLALDGGRGGMALLERLIRDAPRVLRPGGGLALEIGENQEDAVRRRLRGAGFDAIRIDRDLAGHPRFARADWKEIRRV